MAHFIEDSEYGRDDMHGTSRANSSNLPLPVEMQYHNQQLHQGLYPPPPPSPKYHDAVAHASHLQSEL